MTPEQMALVRRSFADLQPAAALAAQQFYARLFELDPALRPLFRGGMVAQGHQWMTMLGMALGLLEDPSRLEAALQRLGQRHACYGVQARHYRSVGQALMDTLAGLHGPAFTPPLREAWAVLFTELTRAMRDAAAALPPPPSSARAARAPA